MWDRKAIDAQLDKMSGLESETKKEDSFDIWKEGYELKKRERDAKKLIKTNLRKPDRWTGSRMDSERNKRLPVIMEQTAALIWK